MEGPEQARRVSERNDVSLGMKLRSLLAQKEQEGREDQYR